MLTPLQQSLRAPLERIDQQNAAQDPPVVLTDAEALATILADPSQWQAVPANRVAAWLGEAGRIKKIKAFAAVDLPAETPDEIKAAQSGVEAMLLSLSVQGAELDLSPGRNERLLAEGLTQIPLDMADLSKGTILSADDLAALLTRGLRNLPGLPTESDIAAARQANARSLETESIREAINNQRRSETDAVNTKAASLQAAVDLYIDGESETVGVTVDADTGEVVSG